MIVVGSCCTTARRLTTLLRVLRPPPRRSLPAATNQISCRFRAAAAAASASPKNRSNNAVTAARQRRQQQQQQQRQVATKEQQQQQKPCQTPLPDSKLVNAPRARGRDDDALSRYPNLQSAGGVLRGLDYAGTITFALTGSVTAAQSGLDAFGCAMVGMVTAVGGGTIRDAVFLAKRPFWTSETEYIWMTFMTALTAFYIWPSVIEYQKKQQQERRNKRRQIEIEQQQQHQKPNKKDDECRYNDYDAIDATMDTFDAIGLAAFAIVGAQNGVRAGMSMTVSAICGMSTSTFGGLTRDVMCGRPIRIVHSNAEIYGMPALAGAVTYLLAKSRNAAPAVRIGSAFLVCVGSRYMAIRHNVRLHTWDTTNDGLGVTVRKNTTTRKQ